VRSEVRRAGHTRAQRSGTRQQVKLTAAGQLDRYLLPATFRGVSGAPRDKARHATATQRNATRNAGQRGEL